MKEKAFRNILIGLEVGSITVFGHLLYRVKKENDKFKLNYNDFFSLETVKKQSSSNFNPNFSNIKINSIKSIVKNFYDTLSHYEEIDLTIFKNNIKSLKFKGIKTYKEEDISLSDALYDYYDNIIYYGLKINNRVMSHELLHMSSTIYDENESNIRYYGFAQNKNGNSIGVGLTEAYTELLAMRFFNDENSRKKTCDCYVTEVNFVKYIEKIVGREKMMKLYFKADLKGLVEELCKYNDIENVMEFIRNIDSINLNTLCGNKCFSNSEYEQIITSSVKFVVTSYANKLESKLYTNELNMEQLYNEIVEFVNSLNNIKYEKYGKKHSMKLLDKKELSKILIEIFGKQNVNKKDLC